VSGDPQGPSSGQRPIGRSRILWEALDGAGAGARADAIVRDALSAVSLDDIPEDDSVWAFARGPLSDNVHRSLGTFAGEAFDARIATAIRVLSRVGRAQRDRIPTPIARPRHRGGHG
jgi:hypothetical protein